MGYFKLAVTAGLLLVILCYSQASGNCSSQTECKSCLDYKETSCYWCPENDGKCLKKDGPIPKGCKLQWKSYGNCTVPGYVWVVVLPVLGFLILMALLCVFYCCCCRCKMSQRSLDREETKFHRKRMELRAKHDERRAERKLRTDEIRKKYGLHKEDGAPSNYQRFDNEA